MMQAITGSDTAREGRIHRDPQRGDDEWQITITMPRALDRIHSAAFPN